MSGLSCCWRQFNFRIFASNSCLVRQFNRDRSLPLVSCLGPSQILGTHFSNSHIPHQLHVNSFTSKCSTFEVLRGQLPDYNFLKVFGSLCWPNLCPFNNTKWIIALFHMFLLDIILIIRDICAFKFPLI